MFNLFNKSKPLASSAVIVAAGRSSRMNSEANKPFMEIGGCPVLAHTLKAFHVVENIREIVIVAREHEIMLCNDIVKCFLFDKVSKIIAGGRERQQSVYNGILEVQYPIVAIHDAARPLIHPTHIQMSIQAAEQYGAAVVGVPVRDTVKQVGIDKFVSGTIDRNTVWLAQTPQTFKTDIIRAAYAEALKNNCRATDDSFLLEQTGLPVKMVEGSPDNIKITTAEDLVIAERLISSFREDVARF